MYPLKRHEVQIYVLNTAGYAHGNNKTPRSSVAGIFSTAALFRRFTVLVSVNIPVSITLQSVHGESMDRDATDWAINFSLWGLAMLIFGGTILAFLVW